MKTLKIGNNDITLEYSFAAVEDRDCVQDVFKMVSGVYLVSERKSGTENDEAVMVNGISAMIGALPSTTVNAFHAGLQEHHPCSRAESKILLRDYMKESKKGFKEVFDEIKECMEDDGFFDLSGIKQMTEQMLGIPMEEEKKVVPMDHQKKTTRTRKTTTSEE